MTAITTPQQELFDYSKYDRDFYDRSQARKEFIQGNHKLITNCYLRMARQIKAQRDDNMTYSDWLEWCDLELGYKARMAEDLLKIANNLLPHYRAVEQILPNSYKGQLAIATALNKIDTPEQRQEYIERVEAATESKGSTLTEKEIKAIVPPSPPLPIPLFADTAPEVEPIEQPPEPLPASTPPDELTGSDEWFTPLGIIHSVREVMGEIDLDPSSNEIAQKSIKATRYYTKETNGLRKEWHGRVYMNPPFSHPLVLQFCEKLVSEYQAGRVTEAIVLTNSCTDTEFNHLLLSVASKIVQPQSRLKFWNPSKPEGTARQPQTIYYLGDNPDKFRRVFSYFGSTLTPDRD